MKGSIVVTTVTILLVALAVLGWVTIAGNTAKGEEGPWGGVDVNVIEKYAAEAGRVPQEPLINTDQGDLLLFVFTVAGALAGFLAGYSWRKLSTEKAKNQSVQN
jgi:cobalt/nickel transport system permease protein